MTEESSWSGPSALPFSLHSFLYHSGPGCIWIEWDQPEFISEFIFVTSPMRKLFCDDCLNQSQYLTCLFAPKHLGICSWQKMTKAKDLQVLFKHLYDDCVCFVFELASGYVRASFLIQIKWCKLEIWKRSVTLTVGKEIWRHAWGTLAHAGKFWTDRKWCHRQKQATATCEEMTARVWTQQYGYWDRKRCMMGMEALLFVALIGKNLQKIF